jgi:hypothetical protein
MVRRVKLVGCKLRGGRKPSTPVPHERFPADPISWACVHGDRAKVVALLHDWRTTLTDWDREYLAELIEGKGKQGRPKGSTTYEETWKRYIQNTLIPIFIAKAEMEGSKNPVKEGIYRTAEWVGEPFTVIKNLWGRKKRPHPTDSVHARFLRAAIWDYPPRKKRAE